jgi:hypothetical protein
MGQQNSRKASRRPAWSAAAVLLFSSWIAIAALTLQLRTDAEIVAVAFPPWWSTQQALQAAASANATIVRETAIPSVLVVRPEGQAGMTRLRGAGVWLAMDPVAVAACLTFEGEGNRND